MKPIGKVPRGALGAALLAAALLTLILFGVSGISLTGASAAGAASQPFPVRASLPGEQETLALAEAYPGRIEGREVRDGEWALKVGERWFNWAGGRLLPAEDLARREEFVPLRFYSYYRGPRRRTEPSPEQTAALRERNRGGNADTRPRSDAFLDGLYGLSSETQAETVMAPVRFLGKTVRVHPLLAEPLARAEVSLRAAEAGDPALRDFIRGIAQIQGYHWREIAGTGRRSYHGYGAALDMVPRSYGGRFAYWRWAYDAGIEEWWSLPEGRIWTVPQTLVETMEAEGFVWGGKWLWYDTVHFEFRPEVLRMTVR